MAQPRKCKARRSNGDPCTNPPMRGQLVCGKHGGRSPQAKAAAEIRLEEDRARRELARLDVPPVTNALLALQQHAGIVTAWRDWCAEQAAALHAKDMRYESTMRIEQLRSEIVLWERALDRATVTLAALARVQVDERLTTIKENDSRKIAAAFDAALAVLGLPAEAAAPARQAFAQVLAIEAA